VWYDKCALGVSWDVPLRSGAGVVRQVCAWRVVGCAVRKWNRCGTAGVHLVCRVINAFSLGAQYRRQVLTHHGVLRVVVGQFFLFV
jgi:hypothetical protein